jgi:ribosomal protein S18 acetylase RimI-like enzyme
MAVFKHDDLISYVMFAEGNVAPRLNSGGSRFRGIGWKLPVGVDYMFKGYVKPSYRGRGVISAAIQHHVDQPRAERLHSLVTSTSRSNRSAIRNLHSMGFRQAGSTAEYVIGSRSFYRIPEPLALSVNGKLDTVSLYGATGNDPVGGAAA